MTAFQYIGWCRVEPRRHGQREQMPVGFRKDHAYRIVAGSFPNGSSDLHYMVINASGQTVPLKADDVRILDDPKYDGHNRTGGGGQQRLGGVTHVLEIPFSDSTMWTGQAPDGTIPAGAWFYDDEGNRLIPLMESRSFEDRSVTAEFGLPTTGKMVLLSYAV